jgi:hypothetical protein
MHKTLQSICFFLLFHRPVHSSKNMNRIPPLQQGASLFFPLFHLAHQSITVATVAGELSYHGGPVDQVDCPSTDGCSTASKAGALARGVG